MIGLSIAGTRHQVQSLDLTEEPNDRWIASLQCLASSQGAISGAKDKQMGATLVLEAQELVGTVLSVTKDGESIEVVVVGGSGGLSRTRRANNMGRDVTMKSVVVELLTPVGEQLGRQDASFLTDTVPAFSI